VPKWLEIDPSNLHTKFSALNVDFSSPSPNLQGSKRPAHVGYQIGVPPPVKSGYFTAIGSCSMKMVADRYIHAAYHMLIDVLCRFINIEDLELPKKGFK